MTRDGKEEELPVVKIVYVRNRRTLPVKEKCGKGKKQAHRQKGDSGRDWREQACASTKFSGGKSIYPLVVSLEAICPQEPDAPEKLRVKSQTKLAEAVQQEDGSLHSAITAQ